MKSSLQERPRRLEDARDQRMVCEKVDCKRVRVVQLYLFAERDSITFL